MSRAVSCSCLFFVAGVLLAGCGGGSDSSSPSTAETTAGAAAGSGLMVGLVTDIGGLNDRSFNHLA